MECCGSGVRVRCERVQANPYEPANASGSGANGGSDLERCSCDDAADDAAKVAARMIEAEKIGATLCIYGMSPLTRKKVAATNPFGLWVYHATHKRAPCQF